ncbi:MAG: hypothetical protein JXN59_18900 [Anaerolineae bacterium]|nr:hypothetical protein [Anaerolineae bacterium]
MTDPTPADGDLVAALRRSALALVQAIPDKIDDAPLHQVAAALRTTVELLKALETPDESTQEQVIRWEFVYNGAVHDAPPWAGGSDGASGPVPRGRVRAALGQNPARPGGAA